MIPQLAILDLDGTVYRGGEVIPGTPEAIQRLRAGDVTIRFLTNNSALTRAQIAAKLNGMGIETTEAECFGTAYGAARYLAEHQIARVFVVGEEGLVRTLSDAGIEVSDDADSVVAGICRQFTYDWLNMAMQALRRGGRFIATNTDATYPMEAGLEVPGAGTIVAAIQTACGRPPDVVIGKPEPTMVHLITEEAGCPVDRAVVIGDRLDTDLEAGQRAGCATHLVLSGVTREAPLGQSATETLLDWVIGIGL